jgi:hypothetical protein
MARLHLRLLPKSTGQQPEKVIQRFEQIYVIVILAGFFHARTGIKGRAPSTFQYNHANFSTVSQ